MDFYLLVCYDERAAREYRKDLCGRGMGRMRRKLYGNNIQPTCEHCLFGRKSSDGKAVLCTKKGVMPLYHHCRKFEYDPLKRVPFRQPSPEKVRPDDFSLE